MAEFYYRKDGTYSSIRDWLQLIGIMTAYVGGYLLLLRFVDFII